MKIVPIVAILCITAIEIFALSKGIDGVVMGATIAVIAGIGGYTVKEIKKEEKD